MSASEWFQVFGVLGSHRQVPHNCLASMDQRHTLAPIATKGRTCAISSTAQCLKTFNALLSLHNFTILVLYFKLIGLNYVQQVIFWLCLAQSFVPSTSFRPSACLSFSFSDSCIHLNIGIHNFTILNVYIFIVLLMQTSLA